MFSAYGSEEFFATRTFFYCSRIVSFARIISIEGKLEKSVPRDAKVYIMNAENFRKGREDVDRIIVGVGEEIKAKFVLQPDKKIKQAQQIVDGLAKEASGEIQNRSVYNMNMKIKSLKHEIEKLSVKKQPAKRARKK